MKHGNLSLLEKQRENKARYNLRTRGYRLHRGDNGNYMITHAVTRIPELGHNPVFSLSLTAVETFIQLVRKL